MHFEWMKEKSRHGKYITSMKESTLLSLNKITLKHHYNKGEKQV